MLSYVSCKKQDLVETFNCEIINVTSSSRNNSIHFIFKEKSYRVAEYSAIVEELSATKNYDDFRLQISVKEGLFDTYFLEDWEIIE